MGYQTENMRLLQQTVISEKSVVFFKEMNFFFSILKKTPVSNLGWSTEKL